MFADEPCKGEYYHAVVIVGYNDNQDNKEKYPYWVITFVPTCHTSVLWTLLSVDDLTDLLHIVILSLKIIRNSWGSGFISGWGMSGYGYIRSGANICGIEDNAMAITSLDGTSL